MLAAVGRAAGAGGASSGVCKVDDADAETPAYSVTAASHAVEVGRWTSLSQVDRSSLDGANHDSRAGPEPPPSAIAVAEGSAVLRDKMVHDDVDSSTASHESSRSSQVARKRPRANRRAMRATFCRRPNISLKLKSAETC